MLPKQSMRFTVLRSKAVSPQTCDKQHQPPLVNYMPTTLQWEFKIQCFRRQQTGFFPTFWAQNMVRVVEGKIIQIEMEWLGDLSRGDFHLGDVADHET